MTRQHLIEQIFLKKSYLCVGLDTAFENIPNHLKVLPDAVLEFNKNIIDATKDVCIAYKINTAFYEALGTKGWEIIEKTVEYIPNTHLKIADAKRGDIGNTSSQYAKAFFETLNFDAVTVAPYMGEDSVRPFLAYKNKWTIVLALTSNTGSQDFQQKKIGEKYLYEEVLEKVSQWGTKENLMFVVGATKAENINAVRKIIPDNFLLIPGIGAQGGSLAAVSKAGLTSDCGLLVNASRAIIYAGSDEHFKNSVAAVALSYKLEMKELLEKNI